MVEAIAPAAQRLVQAGLFDRRAVTESKRRHAAATWLIDDAVVRLGSDAAHQVEITARIVALRADDSIRRHEREPRPTR
jgi:hypothetical protein